MTPKTVTYVLDINTLITQELIKEIHLKGHTRIPLYDETIDNIKAVLCTKDLIGFLNDKNGINH